jgi:hypothetical protein
MNRRDVIREYNAFLRTLKLRPSEVTLGAGGALLMHGLRTTTKDMDISIEGKLFNTLATDVKSYKPHYFGAVKVLSFNNCIDLHERIHYPETTVIDGVCCYSLVELLKQKTQLNRDKDQVDIVNIRAALCRIGIAA